MPKAPPKNGYYYFMLDFRDREQRAGRHFRGGMPEIANAASEEWKNLPQEERDRYNDYAKQNRGNEDRPNVPKKLGRKYNSRGVSFDEVERAEKIKKQKEMEIENFVKKFVRAKDIDNLKEDSIYLIHVNIFCKTDDNVYYPAELAICKFSIKKGPMDSYHTFIDPREIKKGYRYAVQEHSDKTHKITLDHVRKCDRYQDYVRIYDEICSFLKLGENQSVPLFTMYDDPFHNTSLIAVEKTLETLWESKHSAPQNNEVWRKYSPVYPLPLLFTELKNHCFATALGRNENAFPNSSLAISELNKDTYNFRDEFGCDFHQQEDAVLCCSKSYVTRWAQIICDHCCVPLGLQFTDGTETEFESDTATSMNFRVNEGSMDDDDDRFTDCQSTVSGISVRTANTNITEKSIHYSQETTHDQKEQSSNISEVSSRPSSVWCGGRGRARRAAAAPTVDDDNFPTLAGVGRGIRSMKLNR